MPTTPQIDLLSYFEHVTDPRVDRTKRHLLSSVIGIAILAVLCGADNWMEIEWFDATSSGYPPEEALFHTIH